jgi:hypothetical protein
MLNFTKKIPSDKNKKATTETTEDKNTIKKGSKNNNYNEIQGQSQGQGDLWLQLYKPTTAKELAMHHSRVKTIRDWIIKATTAHKESYQTPGG